MLSIFVKWISKETQEKKRGEFMLAQIQAMFAVVDLGKINWNQFLEKYLEIAMSIIGKVIVSFLIIAIGFKLIKILIKLLKNNP